MPPTPNPLFKFNRDAFSVQVTNVSDGVSKREVFDLFNSLIGGITKCEEAYAAGRRYFALSFSTQDAAKKALCMSGYNVDGSPLTVNVAPAPDVPRASKTGRQPDIRRNLYVLGLPFDLTKAEFAEIFSRFGTVAHAVILATVDNASRRRGFVVMHRHHEAKAAMDGLNRKDIKGHIIDVSWAVVQRSEGFLDGGDRATVLANSSPSPSPAPFDMKTLSPALPPLQASIVVTPPIECPSASFAAQSSALLVKNLPAALFSQLSDLHPLLGPYGDVKKLELLPPASGDRNHVSAIVEYGSPAQATDAAHALHGQAYSETPISVEFVNVAPSLNDTDGKGGLNPHAPPFVVPTGLPPNTVLTSVTPVYPGTGFSQAGLAALSKGGLVAVDPRSLSRYGTPLLYVPLAGVRPSSAPTSPRYEAASRYAYSSTYRFSTPSSPIMRPSFVA
ncbi:RNA-binding domain-containing protein [Polyporus arcularius HHB13444]|uniref:RNA-binding domain-containing protein n=1 Tax=Polyporus arcularius HHB13444 TaxID=1314778 RepID=A0A5C3PUD3_9APHY|nr:RNA-binding domain-containing protein [Polyporus arcularius HHB13444]